MIKLIQTLPPSLALLSRRKIIQSAANYNTDSCKLLIIGGGTGGITMASKFARKLNKDNIIVLEPSLTHYYQPLFTLVGAGVYPLAHTARQEQSVMPKNVEWIIDSAECINPDCNQVTTQYGRTIGYEFVIIACGIKNNYDKITGLSEALSNPDSGVSTIYDPKYCEDTFRDLKKFSSGNAIFTFPDSPIKCPGAPQKIAYLADSYFTKTRKRRKASIYYNSATPTLFGVPKYAAALEQVAVRKNIELNFKTVLKRVENCRKEADFYNCETGQTYTMPFEMLHVTPPMKTPDFLYDCKSLVDENGYLKVNKHTLQHVTYQNVYGIGDCTNTPNSKTAAAIAKQCYVVQQNLLATMKDDYPAERYDGYGACPLVTSYNTCILAEFLYDGVVSETFPFDQSKERRSSFYMKKYLFPFIYWNLMLKGYYHGPEFVKDIFNPTG